MHTLTDGRDTEDGTSVRFMTQLCLDLAALAKRGCDARVASGGGRMIVTMDRYEVWEMPLHSLCTSHADCVILRSRDPALRYFRSSGCCMGAMHTRMPLLQNGRCPFTHTAAHRGTLSGSRSMVGAASCTVQSDWNVVKRGWEAHVLGEAPNRFTDPVEAIKALKVSAPCGP